MKKIGQYTYEFPVLHKIKRLGCKDLKDMEVDNEIKILQQTAQCGHSPTFSYHFTENYSKLIIEIE
jgi:hypothetical protein